ncbi:MAG: BamA/TamA family outer membrane protein [Paludibacteraceae bacterium]|nr:BamA/TamA family outer membrane protein [Paludibacteraceae bacterium]
MPLVVYAEGNMVAVSDTLSKQKHTFYVVPTVEYLPETNWAFGLTGANYFAFTDIRKVSSLSYSFSYSLSHHYSVDVYPKIYFGRWYLYANTSYKHKTDIFYGIGNRVTDSDVALPYVSDIFSLNIQPQYFINKYWSVGGALSMHYEKMQKTPKLDSLMLARDIAGGKPYFVWSIGAVVSYDSRDNLFYPQKGMFFKSLLTYSEPYLGSAVRMGRFNTEFRHFVPIYNEFLFAWQVSADMVWGKSVPFQLLPTFGGCDLMRGFRKGRWRDDVALALQAEFRMPIYWRLKAAVFGSVGDVYNWKHWQFTMPKFAYGVGLRLRFNKAKVNLRFDIARTNYGNWRSFKENWNFYFTASEAF